MAKYIKSDLKRKALKCAISDLDKAHNKEYARKVYKKWAVFHNEYEFKQAVNRKKTEFKQ